METENVALGSRSLLYVEDDEGSRIILRSALKLEYPRMRVDVANNGAEGLILFQEHRHEIVITDINMPVMDGLQMSSEIRQLEPKAKIIVITANSDDRNMQRTAVLGIENYVLKPFKLVELFDVLNGMMLPEQICGALA